MSDPVPAPAPAPARVPGSTNQLTPLENAVLRGMTVFAGLLLTVWLQAMVSDATLKQALQGAALIAVFSFEEYIKHV